VHGPYSFFVAAASEEEAKKAVVKYIAEHIGKNDGHYIDEYHTQDYGTDSYILTVLNPGDVITNCND
jgi:hypothetical protein